MTAPSCEKGRTFPLAMTDAEIEAWIAVCNHEPAREVLRQAMRLSKINAELRDEVLNAFDEGIDVGVLAAEKATGVTISNREQLVARTYAQTVIHLLARAALKSAAQAPGEDELIGRVGALAHLVAALAKAEGA